MDFRGRQQLNNSVSGLLNTFAVDEITTLFRNNKSLEMDQIFSRFRTFLQQGDSTEIPIAIHRDLSTYLSKMIADFERAKRVDHGEYAFVMHVAEAWYRETKRVPTPSRNDYTAKKKKSSPISVSRLFEPFIETVVPNPKIRKEIVRSAGDAFRKLIREANQVGGTTSEKGTP